MENQTPEENIVEEAIKEAREKAEEMKDTCEKAEDSLIEESGEEVSKEASEETDKEESDVDTEEASDNNESEDGKEKKGFFKKKKDKKDELIEELTDKNKRMLAEFENFRNRSDKEKSAMFEVGAKTVVEKILPVLDNFERGLSQKPEGEGASGFVTGMEMVYKQLLTGLDEIGVKPIEAVGNEFDPELHNAVMHVDDENVGENIIVEEFQKGYMYKESVVRHSMVKVAN